MESTKDDKRAGKWFWWLLGIITLLRLIPAGRLGLGVDESHYVMFTRHLAWGYFDHPPFVAFLAAATMLLGKGIFFIRLGPVLCYVVSMVLLKKLADALYDSRIALGALVVLLLMPVQQFTAVALLPDAMLNVFWCGGLLAFWHAMRTGKWRWWLLGGVTAGGALLSKYHGVLLPICLSAYVLSSRERRIWLRRPQAYIAGLTALLVFSPNILWNARNGWVSYAFQIERGGGSGGFSVVKLFESLGGQAAAASPIIFGLFIAAAIVLLRHPENEADRFVLWTSLPVLVFFCGIGIFGRILPHWPAVGWWTGALMLATVVTRCTADENPKSNRWRRWSIAGAVLGLVTLIVVYVSLFYPLVGAAHARFAGLAESLNARFSFIKPLGPFKVKYDPTNDLYGAPEVSARVETVRAAMPRPERTFVFCHRFYTLSQLALYLNPDTAVTTLGPRMDQYRLWFDAAKHEGWDAVFVDDEQYLQGPDVYLPLFERADERSESMLVCRRGYPARRVTIYRYYGFKGGTMLPARY